MYEERIRSHFAGFLQALHVALILCADMETFHNGFPQHFFNGHNGQRFEIVFQGLWILKIPSKS